MKIVETKAKCFGIKLSKRNDWGIEIGRVFLFVAYDSHSRPRGIMEDIEVVKKKRGQGIGTSLTKLVKKRAKEFGCRKLIINSRDSRRKVHKLYKKLGFRKHGKEFRIDF